MRVWRMELMRMPETCVLLGKVLDTMLDVAGNVAISESNITRNLDFLGGMILALKGEIPHKGEIIEFKEYTFEILEADDRKIETVKFQIKK